MKIQARSRLAKPLTKNCNQMRDLSYFKCFFQPKWFYSYSIIEFTIFFKGNKGVGGKIKKNKRLETHILPSLYLIKIKSLCEVVSSKILLAPYNFF